MKKLFILLLFPAFATAQNPFSTYELVKDSVTKIAVRKADSINAILQAQVTAAIAALNAAKLNVADTPTIANRVKALIPTTLAQLPNTPGFVTSTTLAEKPDTSVFLPGVRSAIAAKVSTQMLMDTSATKPDKCATLAELRTMAVRDGRVVVVADKATAFDNTGGFYRWNPSSTSAEDTKYLNVIASSVSGTGRWIRMFQRAVDMTATGGTMLTLAGNYKEYNVSGTTNSSGQIVWNLTDDGTATGNALFTSIKIIQVTVDQDQPNPEDAVATRRISLSTNLKVLTYGFSKPKVNPVTTALALAGVSIVPTQSVVTGVPATLIIKGLTP